MNSEKICQHSLGFLFVATALGACGGATNDDIRTLKAECSAGSSTACNAVGGGGSNAPATELFTTAPSSLNLSMSAPVTYTIGGGTAPYSASSSNPNVVQVTVSGNSFTMTRLAPGPATITIVDMAGKTVKITVNSPALFSTAPSTVTLPASGSATFTVDGGTGSYTATSSDPNILAASMTGSTLTVARVSSGPGEIMIFDSEGESIRIVIKALTLFSSAPSSVQLARGDNATYLVGGGTGQYTATSSNPHVLSVSMNGPNVTVKRLELGVAQVNVIDSQGNSLQFQVTSPDLFTTAPPSVTLQRNGAAAYSIGGGTGPYTATSSNTTVLQANATGSTLTLSARTPGLANVSIVDAVGRTINLPVEVDVTLAGDIPPTLSPSSLVLSDCETNVPLIFQGTQPFSVYSGDNVHAPVSSPRQLDENNNTWYFLVSTNLTNRNDPYPVELTVMDARSRTAVSQLTITGKRDGGCPTNPVLKIESPSANARVTEKLRFRVSGGIQPYKISQTPGPTHSPDIVEVGEMNADGTSFDVTAKSPGTTLITVESADKQHSSIAFRVHRE